MAILLAMNECLGREKYLSPLFGGFSANIGFIISHSTNFLRFDSENPRKCGERSAKASRKKQVPSPRVGPFQSEVLIPVYFF